MNLRHLDVPALRQRRAELARELVAVDAEMERREREWQADQHRERLAWAIEQAAFPAVIDLFP